MKYVKLPDKKEVHLITNENTLITYTRQGFVECNKKGEPLETAEPETEE